MVPAISVFASGLYPHVEANPFSEFQRFDTVSAGIALSSTSDFRGAKCVIGSNLRTRTRAKGIAYVNEIRVLVADDRALIRSGIRAHLEELPGLQIVAEARDGPEALRLIRHHQPDVALIECAMYKLNGFEVTARVKKECPKVQVIVLSTHAEEECLMQAMSCGA